jgi:hypothetical protein
LQNKEKHIESLNSELNVKTTNINQLQTNLKSKICEIEQFKEELQCKPDLIKELEINMLNKVDEIKLLKTSKHKKSLSFLGRKIK